MNLKMTIFAVFN